MNARTLNVVVGIELMVALALSPTAHGQELPETSGYLVESSSENWLALSTPTDTWLVQLPDGCSITPDVNVNVIGSPDDPGAQIQSTDGLTSCQLATTRWVQHDGCVLNPRTATCDVHYNWRPA